ncbi:transmembrane amino acid transporter protein-domain-containing protein [Fusarium oxysporum]|nr:transmembrane amino acid transporter protein-domain-containing protein [Fusarium oxysporum]
MSTNVKPFEDGKTANGADSGQVPDGDTIEGHVTTHDAVFGEITENGPNYRNVGWLGTAALMMKTQIGLGVLGLPTVFHVLGIVPGVILLCIIGGITTWSNYIVGIFKIRHPEIYGIDDVGGLLFGRIGREVLGICFCLFFTFVSGSALLSISIAFNALSDHAVCTAVFVAVAAAIGFAFSSIRTLDRIGSLAWIGVSCIIVAVFVVTVGVGVQDRPPSVPKNVQWRSDYELFGHPSFIEALSAISTIIFAYAGTPAFFAIAAEMRDPKQYMKSLIMCQTVISIAYIVVGVVVYYYCGSFVASPALGSAGPTIKKVSYGIGLPGLLISAILLLHLPSKFVFVRILRGSKHLSTNSFIHWATWLGSTFSVTLVAYIIASAIPVFGQLVSLIGALLGTLMSFQPMGCMWLYDNWHSDRRYTPRWYVGVAWSVFVVISGTFLMIAGTYSTIVGIVDSTEKTSAWSCADNSNSS